MASIGSLYGTLTLRDDQYAAALKRNADRTRNFARGMGREFASLAGRYVGPAALVAGIAGASREALQLTKNIKTLSEQSGLPLEQFQTLDYVFRQNEASGEDAAQAVSRLQQRLSEAASGSKDARQDFASLGLNWERLAKLPIGEAFYETARASTALSGNLVASGAAADILGIKQMPRLRASLAELAEKGFPALTAEAKRAGQIVSADVVKSLNEADQAIENLKRKLLTLGTNFVGGRIAGWQLMDSKDLPRLNAAEVAFNSLLDEQARYQAGKSSDAALDSMRINLAQKVAAEEGRVTGVMVTGAQEALEAYRASLAGRGHLAAANTAYLAGLDEQLTSKMAVQEQKRVTDAAKAALDRSTKEMLEFEGLLAATKEEFTTLDREFSEALVKAVADHSDKLAENLRTPAEVYRDSILEAQQLLRGVEAKFGDQTVRFGINPEIFDRAVGKAKAAMLASMQAVTAEERYLQVISEVNEAQREGRFMGPEGYNRAIEDAADGLRAIRTPSEDYGYTLRMLDRLHRDNANSIGIEVASTAALARARRDATEQFGQSHLGEIQRNIEIARAARENPNDPDLPGGTTQAERDLDSARRAYARGSVEAGDYYLEQARRGSRSAAGRGVTLEEGAGGFDYRNSPEGRSLIEAADREAARGDREGQDAPWRRAAEKAAEVGKIVGDALTDSAKAISDQFAANSQAILDRLYGAPTQGANGYQAGQGFQAGADSVATTAAVDAAMTASKAAMMAVADRISVKIDRVDMQDLASTIAAAVHQQFSTLD